MIAGLDYDTKFDWKTVCKACPFDAFRPQNSGYMGVCLKPDHYRELQDEATADTRRRAEAAAEKAKQHALAAQERARAQLKAATGAEKEQAKKTLEIATKTAEAVKNGLPVFEYGKHAEIEGTMPDGCTPNCPCRAKAIQYGRIVTICTSPGRLNALKSTKNKDEKAARRETCAGLLAAAEARMDGLLTDDTVGLAADPRALAVLALGPVRAANVDVRRALLKALPAADAATLGDLLTKSSYEVQEDAARDALASLAPSAIMRLALSAMVRKEMHDQIEYGSDRVPLTAWWLAGRAADAPTHICPGCGEGVPDGAPHTHVEEPLEVEEAPEYVCRECGDALPPGVFDGAVPGPDLVRFRMTSGEVMDAERRAYCDQCGPMVYPLAGTPDGPTNGEVAAEAYPETVRELEAAHAG